MENCDNNKVIDTDIKTNTQKWMREQPVWFLENKGQMLIVNFWKQKNAIKSIKFINKT